MFRLRVYVVISLVPFRVIGSAVLIFVIQDFQNVI